MVGVDLEGKSVALQDGTTINYQACISTMPLDYTLRLIGEEDMAGKLFYSSSHVIGIGLRGKIPHGRKCWLYYPENNCPFYRCTCFSTYAQSNCPTADKELPTIRIAGDPTQPPSEPKPGPYWSLMFEVSESPLKKVNKETIVEETIQGALNVHLIRPEDEIVSVYHRRLPHGYPTPTVIRDQVLRETLPLLKSKGFWSRGRFGSYKYEVANQDHSLMMGVEAVDNILFGAAEITLEHPKLVAQSKNTDLTYTPPPPQPGTADAMDVDAEEHASTSRKAAVGAGNGTAGNGTGSSSSSSSTEAVASDSAKATAQQKKEQQEKGVAGDRESNRSPLTKRSKAEEGGDGDSNGASVDENEDGGSDESPAPIAARGDDTGIAPTASMDTPTPK